MSAKKLKAYNPMWLVEVAPQVKNEYPWLVEELKKCVIVIKEDENYIYFITPENPNMPGSEWQIKDCIILENTKYGEVVLDVLKGNRIGGIEFLSKVFKSE